MDSSVPATGEGISVSTLSVETSTSGSSAATVSPTDLSQRLTVPSVTDSPRAGSTTGVLAPEAGSGACAGGSGALNGVVAGGAAGAAGGGAVRGERQVRQVRALRRQAARSRPARARRRWGRTPRR